MKVPQDEVVVAFGHSPAAIVGPDLEENLAIDQEGEKLDPRKAVLPARSAATTGSAAHSPARIGPTMPVGRRPISTPPSGRPRTAELLVRGIPRIRQCVTLRGPASCGFYWGTL